METADLIINKPIVPVVKSKFLRLSVIVHSGNIVCKQFPCSQAGRRDVHGVTNMQSYVRSAEAIVWLNSYTYSGNVIRKKQSISGMMTCFDWLKCLVSACITFLVEHICV